MHLVAVLALDGVIAFDLATPIEVFGRAGEPGHPSDYEVVVAGPKPTVGAGPIRISVPGGLDVLARADTVIVPGRDDGAAPIDARTSAALVAAAHRGARIASICVGALDLAATGLLDGLRATTHWRAAGILAERFPRVDVDPRALFVDNGAILTSAGASAGIDLCLHMIARDLGGEAAARAARAAVMPLTREAGQAQFLQDDVVGALKLSDTLTWIEQHSAEPLTVAAIARHAAVSTRTLNRRFAEELGVAPSTWLTRARVRQAQRLLQTTDQSVDRIAHETGLGSAANLRAHFSSIVGTTPSRYRVAFARPAQSRL